MTIRMPITLTAIAASAFLSTGCLNVPEPTLRPVNNKPHAAISVEHDRWTQQW